MISLAAAITIQKIADSSTAITLKKCYFYFNYTDYANYRSFYIPLFKYPCSIYIGI